MKDFYEKNKKIIQISAGCVLVLVLILGITIPLMRHNNPQTTDPQLDTPDVTVQPSDEPTNGETEAPTEGETEAPTEQPTEVQTEAPTETPTEAPTQAPTEKPKPQPKPDPKPQPKPDPKPQPDVEEEDRNPNTADPIFVNESIWNSWTKEERDIFLKKNPLNKMSHVDYVKFRNWLYPNGYDCPKGHHCEGPQEHDDLVSQMQEGCAICGKKDCPSFFVKDSWGWSRYDSKKCPQYNEMNDLGKYCQRCHKPRCGKYGDPTKCCTTTWCGMDCPHCGKWIDKDTCHTCTQADVDAFNNKKH